MRETELSPRKQAVLKAVVKTYIETGEPVGSKILTDLLTDSPSSATLRNEMNELCGMGFLNQPHTSAGRVPTSLGYRHYVKNLMQPKTLDEKTKTYIDGMLSANCTDFREIPERAAKVLSELTGLPSVFCYKVNEDVILKRVELLPVGRRGTLLLAVTSDGRTECNICRIPEGLTPKLAQKFSEIVQSKLLRKPLRDFDCAMLQNVVASSGIDSFDLMPVITELFSMASNLGKSTVKLVGLSNLYNICSFDKGAKIAALINREDTFFSVLDNCTENTDVIFGSETGFGELSNQTLVLTNYSIKNKYCGKIGIIGPDRMSYEQIIPSIEYVASHLSSLMSEAFKDMED